MRVKKAFRYRIYPTAEQERHLAVQFGHARFVYNYYRAKRDALYQETGQGMSCYDTIKDLTQLKRHPAFAFLQEADSQVLQQSLTNLQAAYDHWFRMCRAGTLPSNKGQKPRRDGKPRGYPRFHCKRGKQSIRYPQRFKVQDRQVYLPKVGWVKGTFHRPLAGTAKNCTVSKTKSGKYFVSIQCEVHIPDPEPRDDGRVGLDLGLMDFATTSAGEKIPAPKYLRRAERRLKIRQRRLSRKQPGSQNREPARPRLAVQHEKVANQRRDFHHQLSRDLVDRYAVIAMEDLHIKGLVQNHRLAKSISDAGWAQFVRFLVYKALWSGGTVLNADRFFPSSKLCSECGEKNQALALSDRQWVCLECGTVHDRDVNAAVNLLSITTGGAPESYACGDMIPDGESAQEAQAFKLG